MWKKIRSPLLILSLSLNLAVVAVWFVQFAKPDGNHLSARSLFHQEIGVTAEQWRQIEPIMLEFHRQSVKQEQQLETLRQQLLGLLTETPTDRKAIRLKQEEILKGQERMQNLVIDHLLKEKEILSPSQAKRLIQEIHRQCMRSGDLTGRHVLE